MQGSLSQADSFTIWKIKKKINSIVNEVYYRNKQSF